MNKTIDIISPQQLIRFLLFYRQNIREASDIKDFHDTVIGMDYFHQALPVHFLLRGEKHAQTGGGNVVQLGKVHDELGHAVQAVLDFLLQLRRGGGVQSAIQGNGQDTFVLILDDVHD